MSDSALNYRPARTITTGNRIVLRGTELRYALIRLIALVGPATVPELLDGLEHWGFAVAGGRRRRSRMPCAGNGAVAGSVGATGGSTASGRCRGPPEHRIIRRVKEMRYEVWKLSLEGGQNY